MVAAIPPLVTRKARGATRAEINAAIARWEAWQYRKRAQLTRAWQKRIAASFQRLARQVRRALPDIVGEPGEVRQADPYQQISEIILDWSGADFLQVMTGLYVDAYEATGTGLNMTLGVYIPLAAQGDPQAEEWAKWNAGRRIQDIDQATRHRLRDHLQEGLRAGLNLRQIAYGVAYRPATEGQPERPARPGIADFIEETYRHRALTIARTETAVAFNIGSHRRYSQAGVTKVKVLDDHGPGSCDECREVHGQIWSLDEMYRRPIQHPSCRRGFSPLIPAFDEPELPEPEEPPKLDQMWLEQPWQQLGTAPPPRGRPTKPTRALAEYLYERCYQEPDGSFD